MNLRGSFLFKLSWLVMHGSSICGANDSDLLELQCLRGEMKFKNGMYSIGQNLSHACKQYGIPVYICELERNNERDRDINDGI